MARTESKMLALGTTAPAFVLPDAVTNKLVSLDDFQNYHAYVIMFICNHCPYVIHVNPEIIRLSKDYQNKGVAFIAISSNDIENYPQDAPDLMKEQALKLGYTFPYLFDETQKTAKDYDAACTPDFYVFDKNKILVYRGRMDESRPNSGIELTGKDLRNALDAILSNGVVSQMQYPSMGCNIKWK
jgi:thiol-disulfide isomerase/thioredoxin